MSTGTKGAHKSIKASLLSDTCLQKRLWAHLVQFSAAAGIQALQQNIDQVDKVDKNNTTSPETNGGGGLHMGPIKEYKDNPKEEDEAKDKGGTWNIIANAKGFDQTLSFPLPERSLKRNFVKIAIESCMWEKQKGLCENKHGFFLPIMNFDKVRTVPSEFCALSFSCLCYACFIYTS